MCRPWDISGERRGCLVRRWGVGAVVGVGGVVAAAVFGNGERSL